ncbi:MAG: DinB family protein [Anaerolineales bacterium]|nr:DinB family protein [Anaerolineales bacterium]
MVLEVVEVIHGFGPFNPGDSAALFESDRQPLLPDEIENVYFRRSGFARDDLLALTRPLSSWIRNWRPRAGEMNISEILRHIGNAEGWYLSRLVPSETLPSDWKHVQGLPLFKFLEKVRGIVLHRLSLLSDGELHAENYPSHWTKHPHEPWTARKALRRMVEHELEHTEHIRQVLSEWRLQLHARMAAERSLLLQLLTGLDEKTLSRSPIFHNTTAKDILAHLAAWDELHTQRVRLTLEGRQENLDFMTIDEQNAAQLAASKHFSLSQALDFFTHSRAGFLELMVHIDDLDLHRRREKGAASPAQRAQCRYRHDAVHAQDIFRWRKHKHIKPNTGPQDLLLVGLGHAFAELLSVVPLVRLNERQTFPVCGEWMLKDLLGHIADWNIFGVAALDGWAAGEKFPADFSAGLDAWNREHVEKRQAMPWDQVWSDLQGSHQALVNCLTGLSQADLERLHSTPWGSEKMTPYELALIFLGHYREHAADVRVALDLSGFPKRLLRHEIPG